jgi:hypothetical protein
LSEETTSGLASESASTPAPASAEAPSVAHAAESVSEGSQPSSGDRPSAVESRESLLDVVRKAAPKREPQVQDGVAGDPRGAPPAPGAQSADDPGPLTQAEMDAYHPRTRKRIAKLLAERDGLQKQIAPLEAQAKTTTELQNFLRQADIAREDFGLVLDLAAAMRRGDFRTFLEGVGPYVKLAQESLGISLPPDLQQAVQMGHMTQDAARYVAQVRSSQQLAESRLTRTTQEASERNYAEAMQQFQASVAGAVSTWEQEVKRADPDYARKEPVVRDLLHAVVQERGPPRSPAEAVEIARQAYARANAVVSRFNPTLRSTQQVPSSINRVNGARAEPKNLKEAIHFALERSR